MASVQAFQVPGVKIWFWSKDHEPAHFHAKRAGEWEMKVHFLLAQEEMVEIVWADKAPSNKTIKELTELAEKHRVALLEQWEGLRQ